MDQKYIDLYDEYTHTALGRSKFLAKLAKLAGGVFAAQALLPLLEVNYAKAASLPPDNAAIVDGYLEYPGHAGKVRAYFAKPTDEGKHPGIIVIHENRGLNPHIEDVARRVAAAGFFAVAPDALSPLGGTPKDTDEARTKMRELDSTSTLKNYLACAAYLKSHQETNGKIGCVGFCWGGGLANKLAAHAPDLSAAVSYYGRQLPTAEVPDIKASLLLHYAGLDKRINSGIAEFESALQANDIDYLLYTYQDVNHAFHNDTAPTRYDSEAAKLSWDRTIDFFREQLQ